MAELKAQIMRKIYFAWFLKKVLNPTTLKVGVLVMLAWQLTAYVSVQNVLANWTFDGGLNASYAFLQSAVSNTEVVTQILMLGIGIFAVLLLRDVFSKTTFVRV